MTDDDHRSRARARRGGVTCVIADRHATIVQATRDFVESRGVTVCAVAHDGTTTLELVTEHQPTLAIVDPDIGGIELTARITRSAPKTGVIIYADPPHRRLLVDALGAGARGFVTKDAPLRDLVRAIEMVCDGRYSVSIRLLGLLEDEGLAGRAGSLSARERSVLRLIVNGVRGDQVWRDSAVEPANVSRELTRAVSKLEMKRIELRV